MLKQLLSSIVLIFLCHNFILACSCISPSSFCESITNAGAVKANIIIRGKVIGDSSKGKEIKVQQLLHGTIGVSRFNISKGFCDLFYNDLEVNKEYIIALNENQDQFFLLSCAISFLKIENEVIKGKISPGINRLDYDDLSQAS